MKCFRFTFKDLALIILGVGTAGYVNVEIKNTSPLVEKVEYSEINFKKPDSEINFKKPDSEINFKKPDIEINFKKPDIEINFKKPDIEINFKKPDIRKSFKKPDIRMSFKEPDTREEQEIEKGKEDKIIKEIVRESVFTSTGPSFVKELMNTMVAIENTEKIILSYEKGVVDNIDRFHYETRQQNLSLKLAWLEENKDLILSSSFEEYCSTKSAKTKEYLAKAQRFLAEHN